MIQQSLSGTGRGGPIRRLGPDPQPSHARRQPVQRVARGRHGAAAARLRRAARHCRAGRRARIALDDFFVRSGVTTLRRGELVTAIELPLPAGRSRLGVPAANAAARPRPRVGDARRCRARRRRRRLGYGSLGPRPLLFEGDGARLTSLVRAGRAVADLDARRTRLPTGDAARPGRSGAREARPWRRRSTSSAQRQRARRLGRAASHAARRAARRPRPDRHQGVLPRRRVRRVHRPPERRRSSIRAWSWRSRRTAAR